MENFTIEFLENYLMELQYNYSDAKRYGILKNGERPTEQWFEDANAKMQNIEESINILYITK